MAAYIIKIEKATSDCGAFRGSEICRILRHVANGLERGEDPGGENEPYYLRDASGVKVGQAYISS